MTRTAQQRTQTRIETRRPWRQALWRLLCVLAGLVMLLAVAPPASAHGYLIRAIPADRAVLERSPSRLQAWFSEGLEPRFTSVSLSDERGQDIPLAESGVVPTNSTQVSGRLLEPLPDGLYIMTLRVAFASDGHVFTERLVFWVGARTAEAVVSSQARSADALEVLWRLFSLPAFALLFGAGVLYQLVLLPGWGNARYAAGGLAPRVMAALNRLIWLGLAVAAGATLLALLQQTAALFAVPVQAVLRDNLWPIVLNETQIGDTLRARLILLALIALTQAAALYVRGKLPMLVAPFWATGAVLAALALGTFSLSSHMAGADLWLLPSLGVHWLHMLATSAWAGGLLALVLVLPVALAPLAPEAQWPALRAVLSRFSALGVVAVGLLISTGLYNAAIQLPETAAPTSAYQGTLALKVALVLGMLLVALLHHLTLRHEDATSMRGPWAIRTRLAQALGLLPREDGCLSVARLRRSLRLEGLIGLGVLGITAVLAATPPPVPASAGRRVEAPAQTVDIGALRVRLSIDPGGPGANAYEVALTQAGTPVGGAQVWLRLVYPALDKRTTPLPLDDVGDGIYASAGAQLDRAGAWQAQLDILLPEPAREAALAGLPFVRVAFAWPLPEVPPVLVIRQPTAINWLAVVLIVGALALWIVPPARRRIAGLALNPESVVIGLAATVVTIAALIGGGILLANTSADLDRRRNPPPAVVNPSLADAASLAAGAAVYEAQCASCHGPQGRGDGPQADAFVRVPWLPELLPSRRDEALHRVLAEGHAQMPPLPLSEDERWAVINYLRSAAFYAPAARAGE